jgi:hypothetical protein
MRIPCKVLASAAFCALVAAYAPPARAGLLNFSFSLTNTLGNVPGTVTGEIDGLSDNSTGAASDVIIETAPAALDDLEGTLPIDTSASGWQYADNSFTVSGGQITDASIVAKSQDGKAYFFFNPNGFNFVTLDGNSNTVGNADGFAGVTYAPLAAASVPEPASFQIGLAALPIVGFWVWKKRMIPASH